MPLYMKKRGVRVLKISKGFPTCPAGIVTAYSASGAGPDIAGSIFINTHNPVIGKSLPGSEMLNGFPVA